MTEDQWVQLGLWTVAILCYGGLWFRVLVWAARQGR